MKFKKLGFLLCIIAALSASSTVISNEFELNMEEPARILRPEQSLSFCEQGHNVFLLFDVSGKPQGRNAVRRFENQRLYAEKVMDAFEEANMNGVHFELAAYSRFSAHIRALTNPRSSDIPFLKKSIESFKAFSRRPWDTRNGYKRLTKSGRYTLQFRLVISILV